MKKVIALLTVFCFLSMTAFAEGPTTLTSAEATVVVQIQERPDFEKLYFSLSRENERLKNKLKTSHFFLGSMVVFSVVVFTATFLIMSAENSGDSYVGTP